MTVEVIITEGNNYILEVGVQGPPGSSAVQGANQVPFIPYHTITATNTQTAMEQLADQLFKSSTAPTANVEEGDLWFDTTANLLKVFKSSTWVIVTLQPDLTTASLNAGYF